MNAPACVLPSFDPVPLLVVSGCWLILGLVCWWQGTRVGRRAYESDLLHRGME